MSLAGGLAVAAAGGAALAWMHRRDQRRAVSGRRAAFVELRGLLGDAELSQDGADYPKLTGRREGGRVELRLLADTIQLRKLPVLWLLVTIHRPVRIPGALDMMIRPDNSEYWSAHGQLPDTLPTPAGWPEQAVLRTDRAGAIGPLLERLTPELQAFAADGRAKEMLLCPRGARLVHRIDESQRGHYLVTRQPLFLQDRVPRATAETLIARGFALAAALERED